MSRTRGRKPIGFRKDPLKVYTERVLKLCYSTRQHLTEIARNVRMSTIGAAVVAAPATDDGVVSRGAVGPSFDARGSGPQFQISSSTRDTLPPGLYVLSFTGLTTRGSFVCPMIHADTGAGFNNSEAQLVELSASDCRAITQFVLPKGAKRLRFNPSVSGGSFAFTRIKLRKTTAGEYYARLVARLVRVRVKNGRDLRRLLMTGVRLLRSDGVKGVAARLRASQTRMAQFYAPSYSAWIAKYDTLSPDQLEALRTRILAFSERPLISVIMPVYNTPVQMLREAIESVRDQLYDRWELCIADDCSADPNIGRLLHEYAANDPRIKVAFRKENGHISEATNSAFALASGDWIALLDHDDILRPHALAEIAIELSAHSDAQLIYSDEDKIDASSRRFDPYFKPDYSRELFRSQNYFNHLTAHRASNIRAVGGWRKGYEGSQDYDLNLRIVEIIEPNEIRHISKVLYHWRAAAGSTATAGSEKSYAYSAGLRALEQHVSRMELPAKVATVNGTPFYRLRFDVPHPAPLVSIIIPTRDKVQLLRACISSIITKTIYSNYEVIVVDNGSREKETLQYFASLECHSKIRILEYDHEFNYSAINNFAAQHAKGSILGLLNNDVEVISEEWLEEMVSWACRQDIGCVGAKLYFNNETIQHAGVILGIGGVANHAHLYEPRETLGYFGRAAIVGNCSAVTGACLLVRKAVYEEVGGLDETHLSVAFNDVDFCLRVRSAGYSNVFTPFAELYHHESVSRGRDDTPEKNKRFASEVDYMLRTWGDTLKNDPYYSVHFDKRNPNFILMS